MEVRRYCDEQEKNVKARDFSKNIMQEDQEFLDFELRDGREQNAVLKLALSKNLAILEEQSFENENARESLRQFLKSVEMQLGDGVVDGALEQPPFAEQNQSIELQEAAARDKGIDMGEFHAPPGQKEGKAFGAVVSNLSHLQASQNTAAGDASTQ